MMGIVSPWESIWRCKLHLQSLMPHVRPQPQLPLLITNLSTIFNVLGLLTKYHNTITAVTNYSDYHSPFQWIVISVRFPFLQDSCQPGVLLSLCRQRLVSSGLPFNSSEGQFSLMFSLVCLIIQASNSTD